MAAGLRTPLNDRDVRNLSIDRNVPGPPGIAARKKLAQSRS